MTMPARKKRRPPLQGAFYLKHRADCPVVHEAGGMTLRDLLPVESTTVSLMELTLSPGSKTDGRTAATAQIIWQILQGAGLMNLGDTQFAVVPGDVVLIPEAHAYQLINKSEVDLRLNQITSSIINPS